MRSVFPWAVSPGAPVVRVLIPLASVSPASNPVLPRCAPAVIRTLPTAGHAVMAGPVSSLARAQAVPVVSAAGGVGAGHRAMANARVPVGPVI